MRFTEEEKDIVRELLAFDYENKMGKDFLKELLFDDEDNKSDYAFLFWLYERQKELVAILGGKKCQSILHKKLSVILFLNELAKERLISIIELEGNGCTGFFWGPYQYSCADNDKVYFVPDGEPKTQEKTDCYFDWKSSGWHPKYNGKPCSWTVETYQDDDVHIKKILNSRIFVSEELRTLAKNDFETVADRSLKVSKRSFWISIAALLITAIAAFATCFQTSLAREQANSAVDISGKNAVALDDLKRFEETTEGYLKRNDSIMSSILNILNKQPKNSGKQTSNSDKQTCNSGKQTKKSDKQTSNSDKQTSKKPKK